MNNRMVYSLIAALILLQVYSLTKITSLQNRMESMDHAVQSVQGQLGHQIDSIYQNVDQRLNEQASLILNASVQMGKVDAAAMTVPVTFTVEPKAVTDTMSVSLDFDGELIRLERDGLRYRCTRMAALSDHVAPKIVIEEDGVKRVEEHPGVTVENLIEQIFPRAFAHFSGESSYGSNEYRAKGRLDIDYKPPQKGNPFVDMSYVVRVDGTAIKETPVAVEQSGEWGEWGGTFSIQIEDRYALDKGQVLTTYVVAVDSLGFTHEYLVTHFKAGEGAQREPDLNQVNITATDGTPVYRFDEGNGWVRQK